MSGKHEAGRFLNSCFGFVVMLMAVMTLTLLMVTLAGCSTDTVQNAKQVAEPVAEPAAGTVALNQYITLSCATDGVDIYYTLDGSEPSSSHTKYAEDNKPQITGTAVLKAIAVKAGMTDSSILTAAYTVDISQVASPEIALAVSADPLLSGAVIFVDQQTVFNAGAGYSSYAWYWAGTVISGESSAAYILAANTKPAGIYEVTVVVSTGTGETLSARCSLIIKAR
jgi:hypothetical protein